MVLAHGFADPADLGIPPGILVGLAVGVLLAAAALLTSRGDRPGRRREGRQLRRLERALPALAVILRLGLGALLAFMLATALWGEPTGQLNPAPRLLRVAWWAVLVVGMSVLVGPWWRLANPVRGISALLARASGDVEPPATIDPRVGVWPAVGALTIFLWMSQAVPLTAAPARLFLSLYLLAMLAGAMRFGPAWYAHTDPFEVSSDLLGRLGLLGHDREHRVRVAGPRASLARFQPPAGTAALAAIVTGSALWDLVAETAWWGRVGAPGVGAQSAGFAVAVAAVTLLVLAAVRHRPFFVAALVPAAAAWLLPHELIGVLLDGQVMLGQLGRPFADLSTATFAAEPYADFTILPTWLVVAIELAVLVGGHIIALAAAHDAAYARYDPRAARAVQFPFRVLLVASLTAAVVLRYTV